MGVVGGIVGASDTVVDVLAEVGSVGTSGVANLEAEHATAHEVVPLDDLLVSVVVATRPSSGVDETAEGVTTEIRTVGIKFSSVVISGEVDEGLVNETNDLDVVWGRHKLNTLEGIGRDEASAMTGLSAPGDFLLFRVSDGRGTGRRSPKTEI